MDNVLLVTFDSLRWDVFEAAQAPYLKSLGAWRKALTPGNFTLPAHMALYMGKLPQTLDGSNFYDAAPTRINAAGRAERNMEFWHLANTEAGRYQRPSRIRLAGASVIEGFRRRGYRTLGTGAVSWFNPRTPAGRHLSRPFDRYAFFDGGAHPYREAAPDQVDWIAAEMRRARRFRSRRPIFAFVNFGETHHPYTFRGCAWSDAANPWGDRERCLERQRLCLEYLDQHVARLVALLDPCDLVLCADHGEAMGEDGLWGHGFSHSAVLQVPLLIRPAGRAREAQEAT